MPRAKHKQELIDTRNATYTEHAAACGKCRHFWHYGDSCQIREAEYRNTNDHHKPVKPWGWCNLFELKTEAK